MRTAFTVSTGDRKTATISTLPANSIDSVSSKAGILADQSEDAMDARMRQKQSPLEYSYAMAGAFAEGVYTEF